MNAPMNAPLHSATAPDLLRLDAENREKAIDPRRSVIVEAPAGAGKTELLTQRFLALLAQVNDPEEIVALTFTNKAAAEMRHRIVQGLQRAALGHEPPEPHKKKTYGLARTVLQRDAQRGWGLLMNAGRLQITTLDALCGKLARQMPLLSRMGSQPQVCTDPEPHYQAAARATLEAVEDPGAEADAIARVLGHFDNDAGRLQALLVAMLASRDQWLGQSRRGVELRAAERALTTLIGQELADVDAAMPPGWQSTLMPWARFAGAQIALAQAVGGAVPPELAPIAALEGWTEPLPLDASALPLWRGVAELLLTQKGEIRSLLPAALGFGTPEGKPLAGPFKAFRDPLKATPAPSALARIRLLPSPCYDGAEASLIADLLTVLKVAAAQLWLGFQAAGEVDFTEVAQSALQALGGEGAPSELALRLDYRISHLLVDEFQDTSPTQVELLRRLTAGWTAEGCRTLFLVGDPMQSIYKFRKADVGLFLKVRDQGLGDVKPEPLSLYRNNRSSADVVEWVNRVFPAVFAAQHNPQRGAVRFTPAQATRPAHTGVAVAWHPFIDAQADDADAEQGPVSEREAQAVVRLVQQAQRDQPEGKVAILVRARTHLQALVQLLRTRHPTLAYQAIEIESLASRQVIQDLLTLTRALLHRGDRTHWLALLRAPWCGLLLQDLHTLAADDHRAAVWDLVNDDQRVARLTADGQQRLRRVRAVLRLAFEHQGRQRLRRWIEGVWQALGGPHCLAGPADLLDAKAFLDAVDGLDRAGRFDLGRLAAEVDSLYAAPDPRATDRLQIMTIHKSKGLEFDTVILPGLHQKPSGQDKKLLLWDEVIGDDGEETLVVAALPHGAPGAEAEPSKFDFLHQCEAQRSRHETQRLLYVAVTRTKQRLHLLGSVKPDDALPGAVKPPVKDSFLSLLWHDAAPHFAEAAVAWDKSATRADEAPPSPETSPSGTAPARRGVEDARLYNHRLVRLSPSYQSPLQPVPVDGAVEDNAPAAAPDNPSESVALGPQGGARHAADVGTLVHRYLQLIAEDGLAHWPVPRVRGLQPSMAQWLGQQGHAPDRAQAAAAEVVAHLVTTLESADGRWVLGPHEEAVCERSYTTVSDGALQAHVIDRMFKADGVRWIVDYKTTSALPEGAGALKAHTEQLARYRQLFAHEADVRTAVYFTAQGRLVVL